MVEKELVKKDKVLVKPSDFKPSSKDFEVIGTINPGVARLDNGDILVYVRVIEKLKSKEGKFQRSPRMVGEDKFSLTFDKFPTDETEGHSDLDVVFRDGTKRLKFISHFRRIILDSSGFKIKKIENRPSFFGLAWDGELGVEDPRITKIGNSFYMTYVALSRDGNITTNLAISNDGISWFRRGVIFLHQNKDVVIFPERINHRYLAFNRPEGTFEFSSPHIWLSYSNNLELWGEATPLTLSKKQDWDSGRVGAGPPPIKLKEGWLFIYHGVIDKKVRVYEKEEDGFKIKSKMRSVYSAGAALLETNNPKNIIAKTEKPFLLPTKKYEIGTFEFKDVVFPTGALLDKDGEHILLFSGGGDVITSVKKIPIKQILRKMKKFSEKK